MADLATGRIVRKNTNIRTFGEEAARLVMFDRAASHLKQKRLADALGIGLRALQYKIAVARGVSDHDLLLAAGALDQLGREIAALGTRLREAACAQAVGAPATPNEGGAA